MEKEFLINLIEETIDNVCYDTPLYATVKYDNGIALLWYHDDYTDSLWDMFVSNTKKKEYFTFIEQEFFIKYKKKLYTTYKLYPILFNNQLSTSIILEW